MLVCVGRVSSGVFGSERSTVHNVSGALLVPDLCVRVVFYPTMAVVTVPADPGEPRLGGMLPAGLPHSGSMR